MTHEEECRALKMIANSRDGVTETVLATHGLAGDLLADLVADGLATVASETVWDEGQPIEVVRVRISQLARCAPRAVMMPAGGRGGGAGRFRPLGFMTVKR